MALHDITLRYTTLHYITFHRIVLVAAALLSLNRGPCFLLATPEAPPKHKVGLLE